jgi:hypothetical protein
MTPFTVLVLGDKPVAVAIEAKNQVEAGAHISEVLGKKTGFIVLESDARVLEIVRALTNPIAFGHWARSLETSRMIKTTTRIVSKTRPSKSKKRRVFIPGPIGRGARKLVT